MSRPDRFRLPKALGAAAWASVVLITYLSLVPKEIEVRTGLPGQFEHLMAYAGTAFLLALAYPRRIAWIGLGLFVYACALEYLQVYIPGRYPHPIDAAASSAGVVIGLAVRTAAMRLLQDGSDVRHKVRHPPT